MRSKSTSTSVRSRATPESISAAIRPRDRRSSPREKDPEATSPSCPRATGSPRGSTRRGTPGTRHRCGSGSRSERRRKETRALSGGWIEQFQQIDRSRGDSEREPGAAPASMAGHIAQPDPDRDGKGANRDRHPGTSSVSSGAEPSRPRDHGQRGAVSRFTSLKETRMDDP